MNPQIFFSFLTYEYKKTQNFTLISNPWKQFEKGVLWKNPKQIGNEVSQEQAID
jgi:hypothetical protein